MKMIWTLIKNEYIKLFRKKSVPILLALLLLLVLGISLIPPARTYYYEDRYIDDNGVYIGNGYYGDPFEDQIKNYQSMIVSDTKLNSMSGYDKEYAIIENTVNKKRIEICQKAIDLEVEIYYEEDNWKYRIVNTLLNNVEDICFYEYVTTDGEYSNFFDSKYSNTVYYESLKVQQESQMKAIEEDNYSESQRGAYETAKLTLEADKKTLADVEKAKDDGTGRDDIDFELINAKGAVQCSQGIVDTYECLLDKKYDYSSDENKTVKIAIQSYSTARSEYFSLVSEDVYNNPEENTNSDSYNSDTITKEYIINNNYYGNYDSYDEYYEDKIAAITENMNKGAVALYSLENDVIEMSVANSTRQKTLSFVNLFWFIAPLAIFFASGMVAKEYSTKTINLLLIRPVKRWKILLSKYICLLSLTLGTLIATLAVYLLGSGISMGFSDLSQPFLFISGETVHAVNFVLWLLGNILIASLPIICLITITFMFSSVTKGNAVSLILGVLTLLSSIFILFFYNLFKDANVLTYLPFPYFSMWSYTFNDVLVLTGSSYSVFSELVDANILFGTVLLLSLTVLSIVIVFTDFNKKDI